MSKGSSRQRQPFLTSKATGNFPDHFLRRAEDGLQEPDRPVQQPQPASAAGVLPAPLLQLPLPARRRVVLARPQRPAHRLPHPEIHEAARHVRTWLAFLISTR